MINQSNLSKNLYDNQSKLTILMIKLIGLNSQCNNMFTKYGSIKFNQVFVGNKKSSLSNEDFNKKIDFFNEIDIEKPEIYKKRTRLHLKEENKGKTNEKLKNKPKINENNNEKLIKTSKEHIKSKSNSKKEEISNKSHSNTKKINKLKSNQKKNRNFDRIIEYDRIVRKNFMPKTPNKTNNNVFIYIPNLTLVDNSHISHISKGKYKDRSNSNLSRNSILNNQKSIVSSISELGITKNTSFLNLNNNNLNTYNNSSYVKIYEQKKKQIMNLTNKESIINNENHKEEKRKRKRTLNQTPSPSPSPSPIPTPTQTQFKKKEKIKINQFKKENINKTNNNTNTRYEKDYSNNEEEYYNENRMTFNPSPIINTIIGQTYSKKKVNLPIDLKKINDECECTEEESQTYSFKDETESVEDNMKNSQNQFIFQRKKGFK